MAHWTDSELVCDVCAVRRAGKQSVRWKVVLGRDVCPAHEIVLTVDGVAWAVWTARLPD